MNVFRWMLVWVVFWVIVLCIVLNTCALAQYRCWWVRDDRGQMVRVCEQVGGPTQPPYPPLPPMGPRPPNCPPYTRCY
jgi:hypothetical protein